MVKIKICGIRSPESAQACAQAGVDLVGLNFVKGRRRAITPEFANSLDTGDCARVGVFIDPTADEVRATAGAANLTWIQLHGQEPVELVADLSRDFSVIKVFRVANGDLLRAWEPYAAYVSAFLFDASTAGQGKTFDWSNLVDPPRPFYLAGGLTPENVQQGIAALSPDGVDTASGVEVDGHPNPDRIRAFCQAARAQP